MKVAIILTKRRVLFIVSLLVAVLIVFLYSLKFTGFAVINSWSKYAGNPILSPSGGEGLATFGDVLKVGSIYHMYYHCDNSICHATSSDGKSWIKDTANNPVLEGEAGQWDSAGAEICAGGIIKVDSTYYAFYEAGSGSGRRNGRKIGVVTSTNLVDWTKDANNPIYSGGRFCPSIFQYGSYYYMLVPHYTSGSNYSQIELYRDTNPTFYSSSREFVKIAIDYGAVGEWDDHDLDTPIALTDDIFRNSFSASNNELWTYYAGESGGIWQEGMIIKTDIAAALEIFLSE
jgi:hypothetical protein